MRSFLKNIITWQRLPVDGEQQMALNRLMVGFTAICFNLWLIPGAANRGQATLAAALYTSFAGLIVVHMFLFAQPAKGRRVLALMADCAAASYELHIGGAATLWQFAGYLWIVFGNGFRFGERFLKLAILVALASFTIMVLTTQYWRQHPHEVLGGYVSLTFVPLYALTLIRRLSKAREIAEQASRAKSLFLTSVSHELRTPLNAIIGMATLLNQGDLTGTQSRMSITILAAARSLLSMIDDVLDLARIETGRITVVAIDFDLVTILAELRNLFLLPCAARGLALHIHVTARTPVRLRGDARKLHDSILNLLGNALKFTEKGYIRIGIDWHPGLNDEGILQIEIADTGPGIDARDQPLIFEMFSQANAKVPGRYGGIGLGLTLVRHNVTAMGGTITVESCIGHGSAFTLRLAMTSEKAVTVPKNVCLEATIILRGTAPISKLVDRIAEQGVDFRNEQIHVTGQEEFTLIGISAPSLQTMPPGGAERVLVGLSPGGVAGLPSSFIQSEVMTIISSDMTSAEIVQGLILIEQLCQMVAPSRTTETPQRAPVQLSVLIADDNATNRTVIEMILTAAGHAVELARNGQEALAALAMRRFDVAILDVNMQILDGIEASEIYCRSTKNGDSVPIIGLTADATLSTRQRCLLAGMSVCVAKPIEPAELLQLVQQVVAGGGRPRVKQKSGPDLSCENSSLLPAIRSEALASLQAIGGQQFARDVVCMAYAEIDVIGRALQLAASEKDIERFRTQAHALRSVATNIGAHHLATLCLPAMAPSQLSTDMLVWLIQISNELERVRSAISILGILPTALDPLSCANDGVHLSDVNFQTH